MWQAYGLCPKHKAFVSVECCQVVLVEPSKWLTHKEDTYIQKNGWFFLKKKLTVKTNEYLQRMLKNISKERKPKKY